MKCSSTALLAASRSSFFCRLCLRAAQHASGDSCGMLPCQVTLQDRAGCGRAADVYHSWWQGFFFFRKHAMLMVVRSARAAHAFAAKF